MDTKTVKNLLAPVQELPRTNRFKRALDIAFAQGIPVEIRVARPFKGFKGETGKSFKVKITNTKTGENLLLCRTKIETQGEVRSWLAKGTTYIGYTREQVIEKTGVQDPADVSRWACSTEQISRTGWAEIGFVVSKLFKSDMVYFDTCGKCSGEGRIPAFYHICEGICFECLGTGGRLALNNGAELVTSSAPKV